MADGQHTRPERAAEIHIARRHLAAVYRLGGCGACKHAEHGWGRSVCTQASKTFPLCLSTPGLQFEIDHIQLRKLEGKCHASSR